VTGLAQACWRCLNSIKHGTIAYWCGLDGGRLGIPVRGRDWNKDWHLLRTADTPHATTTYCTPHSHWNAPVPCPRLTLLRCPLHLARTCSLAPRPGAAWRCVGWYAAPRRRWPLRGDTASAAHAALFTQVRPHRIPRGYCGPTPHPILPLPRMPLPYACRGMGQTYAARVELLWRGQTTTCTCAGTRHLCSTRANTPTHCVVPDSMLRGRRKKEGGGGGREEVCCLSVSLTLTCLALCYVKENLLLEGEGEGIGHTLSCLPELVVWFM